MKFAFLQAWKRRKNYNPLRSAAAGTMTSRCLISPSICIQKLKKLDPFTNEKSFYISKMVWLFGIVLVNKCLLIFTRLVMGQALPRRIQSVHTLLLRVRVDRWQRLHRQTVLPFRAGGCRPSMRQMGRTTSIVRPGMRLGFLSPGVIETKWMLYTKMWASGNKYGILCVAISYNLPWFFSF